jgi:hypothetical protein
MASKPKFISMGIDALFSFATLSSGSLSPTPGPNGNVNGNAGGILGGIRTGGFPLIIF